jgi:hypothetical protein
MGNHHRRAHGDCKIKTVRAGSSLYSLTGARTDLHEIRISPENGLASAPTSGF